MVLLNPGAGIRPNFGAGIRPHFGAGIRPPQFTLDSLRRSPAPILGPDSGPALGPDSGPTSGRFRVEQYRARVVSGGVCRIRDHVAAVGLWGVFRERKYGEAEAVWQWYNCAVASLPDGYSPLRINLDETFVSLYQGAAKGAVFFRKRKDLPPLVCVGPCLISVVSVCCVRFGSTRGKQLSASFLCNVSYECFLTSSSTQRFDALSRK